MVQQHQLYGQITLSDSTSLVMVSDKDWKTRDHEPHKSIVYGARLRMTDCKLTEVVSKALPWHCNVKYCNVINVVTHCNVCNCEILVLFFTTKTQ